jgi:hypothetical protein
MKKLLTKLLLIIPTAFLFNGRNFLYAVTERTLGDSEELTASIKVNTFGFTSLTDASMEYVLFTMTFALIYVFMFGRFLSENLTVSGIYIFIREDNRLKWFVKNNVKMFIQSALVLAVNTAVIYLFSVKMCGTSGEIKYLLKIYAAACIYVWILLVLCNFLSVLFGSTVGLTATAAVHYSLVILGDKANSLFAERVLNPLGNVFNIAENSGGTYKYFISLTVILLIVCTAFCTYVRRTDISLTNKETVL